MPKEKIIKTEHPHIVKVEGVCGGSPVIKGTRTPVRSIVGYIKLGYSVEDILEGLPFLNPAQIYDALSYYYDHKDQIEEDIETNTEEYCSKIYLHSIKQ
ncbi:MAG: DUF433 domain-containing protein [Methanosarcinales archaeon]